MSIDLSRVNPKTVLFEQVTDQVFIKGKVVREVNTSKGSGNWRATIYFTDGSNVRVDEDHGRGMVPISYTRSQAEQHRDEKRK
jgi:hypothetical protein